MQCLTRIVLRLGSATTRDFYLPSKFFFAHSYSAEDKYFQIIFFDPSGAEIVIGLDTNKIILLGVNFPKLPSEH